MVDSKIVLFGQTLGYTVYAVVIILLVGWFGWRLTHAGKVKGVKPGLFYAFVAVLAVLGFSLHITTSLTIPWVKPDLDRDSVRADRVFEIKVAGHRFELPAERMVVRVGETVRFEVDSADLTYGFGLFRPDNSMVFQMQVVPGHRNDVVWMFTEPGLYTVRSTEYSGPKGIAMVVKDALEVLEAR
jgi:cytochrome c oxidase subunit II